MRLNHSQDNAQNGSTNRHHPDNNVGNDQETVTCITDDDITTYRISMDNIMVSNLVPGYQYTAG